MHTNPQPPKARLSCTNPQMSDMSDDDEPHLEWRKALHTNTQPPKDTSSHTNPQTSDTSDDDEPHIVETPSGTSHIQVQVNNPIPNQPQTRFLFFCLCYTHVFNHLFGTHDTTINNSRKPRRNSVGIDPSQVLIDRHQMNKQQWGDVFECCCKLCPIS